MKKIVEISAFAIILVTGLLYKNQIVALANNILYVSKCDTPITYHLGTVDPKFNLNDDELLADIDEAGKIWSNSITKNLFSYSEKGDITINLVYDQRQLLNTQVKELNNNVQNQQKTLDPEIAAYKDRLATFQTRLAELNNKIKYWNDLGGAPPEEYDKIIAEQSSLKQEATNIQSLALKLNQSAADFNSQVGELNQTVDTLNTALQNKPEEGEYIYDKGLQTINIYFHNTRPELIHTLAHELGHSLTINHNANPESIMYPQTTEASSLSPDDLAGLQKACEKRNVINTALVRMSFAFDQLGKRFFK